MRLLTVIFLVFAMLSANFSRLFVFAGFELNQKYIAETLCVNRDKPQMHCNGHCYLMTKLQQAQEKQKQQEKETQKHSFQEAFFEEIAMFDFKLEELHIQNAHIPNMRGVDTSFPLFHPPRA
ncbi:hypothetical protein Pedsa_1449 [Pseudopedobacter saltans DSM 12145]|uniref:Uncharacterized protein n=1 Tax=Pseudopedobacter saltans (strain ATCC 51119 / DSM 12145 / JCM 21818 / CCUG 39354 / LMG 10337 / NBRC 100064 / NCIMB 13643) TaxID=762903 RepID=F0S4M0_PSESL|nr:hypothetical protein [Pseudopedobacter saltans]ADY52011.1 hypothetical protein Pedsa_1449 [Pseudopedobacter saltans DSM 12145]